MSGVTLIDFLSYTTESFRQGVVAAEKSLQWNSVGIRKEGREIETAELQKLYTLLKHVHEQSIFAEEDCLHRLGIICTSELFRETQAPTENDALINNIGNSAFSLLRQEIFFGFPEIDWNVPLSLEDGVALRNYLEQKRHFLLYANGIVDIWSKRFIDMWATLFQHLPDRAFKTEAGQAGISISAPLIDLMDEPAVAVQNLIACLTHDDITQFTLFQDYGAQIEKNFCEVSDIPYEELATTRRSFIPPTKSREPVQNIPRLYLADTPFLSLFFEDMPVEVPYETRFEHAHVAAGTGHGKTQLFQYLIANDLPQVAKGEASVVIIDSQGDLIDNISRLEVFAPSNPLANRLVVVDPTDVAFPVALNMFDMNTKHDDPLEQEKLTNGVLELYDYIFGSLLGAELTQKQGVIFRYVARLMLKIPGATIQHLYRLMGEDGFDEFAEYVPLLDSPTAQNFFETEFQTREFHATKKQVRRRLSGVLENRTFENMFSSPQSKFNLSAEMNAGKVILINTSKDLLKQTGTEIFGRFFIALITQAALERAVLPKDQRMPTFVYVDEANDYFQKGDENLPLILEQARKYRISMTLSHQFLDQLDNKLRSSLSANTSTKIVGGVSNKDAAVFGKEMGCDPAFIDSMRKTISHAEFAIWVKNITRGTMKLEVPFGFMDDMPHMSDEQFVKVRELQRQLYAVPAKEVRERLWEGAGGRPSGIAELDEDDFDISTESGWKPCTSPGDGEAPAD